MANEVQIKVDPADEAGHYANAISIHRTKGEVIIDFGYVLPGSDPATVKVLSRINLSKENAANFAQSLSETIKKANEQGGEQAAA